MKLDSSNLKKLNEIENSPQRIGQYAPQGNIVNLNKSDAKKSGSLKRSNGSFVEAIDGGQPHQMKPTSGSQRPSSIKRMANNVMGIFDKKNQGNNNIKQVIVNDTNDSMSNIPASDLQIDNLPSQNQSTLPPTKDGQRKTSTLGSSFTQ